MSREYLGWQSGMGGARKEGEHGWMEADLLHYGPKSYQSAPDEQ